MEKQTIFIKRLPSKGELPKEDNKDYCSNVGMVYFRKLKFYFRDEQLIAFTDKVEWWLQEIEIPTEEEVVNNSSNMLSSTNEYEIGFEAGANFILNKLKEN